MIVLFVYIIPVRRCVCAHRPSFMSTGFLVDILHADSESIRLAPLSGSATLSAKLCGSVVDILREDGVNPANLAMAILYLVKRLDVKFGRVK